MVLPLDHGSGQSTRRLTERGWHEHNVTRAERSATLSYDSFGWTLDEDNYNLAKFDQINGAWPISSPLPLPNWSARPAEPYTVDKVWQYEDLVGLIETKLQRMLEETHYNTANNFVDFYKAYRSTHGALPDLRAHFQNYKIPINRRHHMCVSLGMEIVSRLAEHHPQLAKHLFLVSCEEAVEESEAYIQHCEEKNIEHAGPGLEKEHALVAMRIIVAGREGVMILDPGYHIARAVTVMKDQSYPHTGWFIQSDEPNCKREYCYVLSHHCTKFITWTERVTRANKQQQYEMSLIYIDRPYRTAIDVTVRRNLVYNFRSLLSRDAKGRVCAGLYFPVVSNTSEAQVTLFYDSGSDIQVKQKFKFSLFRDPRKIPDSIVFHLENIALQLRMDLEELTVLMSDLAEAVQDGDFVKQLLDINHSITEMSADN